MSRVRAKDFGITKQERMQEHYDSIFLRPWILAVKERELGKLMCEDCGSEENLQIHHKRYGIDVTYYDLKLVCFQCHLKL